MPVTALPLTVSFAVAVTVTLPALLAVTTPVLALTSATALLPDQVTVPTLEPLGEAVAVRFVVSPTVSTLPLEELIVREVAGMAAATTVS